MASMGGRTQVFHRNGCSGLILYPLTVPKRDGNSDKRPLALSSHRRLPGCYVTLVEPVPVPSADEIRMHFATVYTNPVPHHAIPIHGFLGLLLPWVLNPVSLVLGSDL